MPETTWLEVSLTVDGELAEAVADVMARFIPNGIVIEATRIDPDPEGEGFPTGPLRVCGYIPMDDHLDDTRHKLEEALWYLGRIRPLPEPQYRPVKEEDWAEAWKEHYHPIAVGSKLIIVPAWLDSPDQNRIPIRLDPGMAFGTGTHPSTQLCLELLEETVKPDDTAIDVGCGSGILSIAALKLGARSALGVDIDPQAVHITRENAEMNGVSGHMEVGTGSVGEILAGDFLIRQADVVLANILAPVITHLFGEGLGDLVAPGGLMILAGIIEEQWDEVEDRLPLREALREHHFEIVEVRKSGDWVAACVKHA